MTSRLLFVCSGNICRSPTAEAVMRARVAERGLAGEIEVDSAGIGDWHAGESPDRRSAAAARRRGIEIGGTARQVRASDFAEFDLILAMDSGHLAELRRLAPPGSPAELRMFTTDDVPDPYYDGEQGFETVLDIVEAGCATLLDELAADGLRQD